MLKFFSVPDLNQRTSIGMLLMRLVLGLGMAIHEWPKIQNPTAWAGDGFPAILQLLAAVSEFGGGLAWIIGALVPLASLGLIFTMAVAVHMHAIVRGDPFVGKDGSYELALIYLVFSVALILIGPGKFSADHYIFKTKK